MAQLNQSRSNVSVDRPEPTALPGNTTAQLQHDIDSGLTGDKVQLVDPALSPLGTDDEAAGRPPSGQRVALARYNELVQRWSRSPFRNSGLRPQGGWALGLFIGFIILLGVVFVVGLIAVAPGSP